MSDGIGFVGLGSSSTRAIAAKRAEALPRRARHRSHQGQAPHGPELSLVPPGDAINAVLAAAGHNFNLLLRWLRLLLFRRLAAFTASLQPLPV